MRTTPSRSKILNVLLAAGLLPFAAATLTGLAFGLSAPAGAQEDDGQEVSGAGGRTSERCSAPEFREFDFWLGRWEVRNPDGKIVGHNEIRRVSDGCGLLESWEGVSGGTGVSINAYDSDREHWTQRWVGSGATLWLEGGLEEGSDGARMVLSGAGPRVTPRGEVRDRISWTPLRDGPVLQVWEMQPARGGDWSEVFRGLYTRVDSGGAESPERSGGSAPSAGSGTSNFRGRVFTERGVSFRNGSVELQGQLVLPAGEGRAPAVVFLHGSGPMTREGFRPFAEAFAKLGVASLSFDKRGTGSSGGSWTTSSLDDLVGDALAAVHYLKTEERVDSSRIGFWGISQGGWIAPRAAARPEDVAFMILISGGGVSPRESELYSYGQAFEEAGFSEAERTEGFAVLDHYFRYLASGESRPALVERLEALEANRDAPLHLLAGQLGRILPSLENRPNWSWVAAYDPASDIAKVTCPVLLIFGDQDKEHPTELAVERWREGLEKAGNDDVTLMIFPGAGHGIRMGRHDGGHQRPPFADGYWEAMLGWLWLHVVESSP